MSRAPAGRVVGIGFLVLLCVGLGGPPGHAEGEAGEGGFVVEKADQIARPAPGPHEGLGRTTGSSFFRSVPGVPFAFTRRTLHPGASIGSHEQHEDEIYFVVSGTGRMTVDVESFDVRPGDGVLTRPGSTHGLVQTGGEDLVIIIVYPRTSR